MSLEGKIAIVTGGARGIGAGIVRSLSKEGAKVAFNYVSSSSNAAADSLVDELRRANREVVSIQANVTDASRPNAIIQATLAAFKTDHIDILVNNAGLGDNRPLEEVTLEVYTRLMDVNVKAVIFMTQAVLPFTRRGGRIINLSSISARGGYPTQSVYAASKAAVEA
ncbi:SDR family NAD(P)-dependent oxidoreductase [Aspergillus mulundensis]|uniref:Uncharacterized protein n=1 Tax=Aspergillus mulundensis TaxID=1810919 RepID=A0A3D8QBX5_9EURO|nr:hypothetical protein DSM5745_11047 [Aspergillus mulundensis]RDW59352.1 hypothetical protein DSM5745_11047 [Aspergillus mulundensis]